MLGLAWGFSGLGNNSDLTCALHLRQRVYSRLGDVGLARELSRRGQVKLRLQFQKVGLTLLQFLDQGLDLNLRFLLLYFISLVYTLCFYSYLIK